MNKAALAAAAALLSGCAALGPDYSVPDLNPPQKYFAGASDELRDASVQPWWQVFGDPALSDFVSIGLAQNLDVRTALERMVAAEESTRLFGASRQVNGDASVDARQRNTTGSNRSDTSLGAAPVYNLDLFGEFRRGREQSLAELDAARFGAGAVKLAYLSDIENSYLLVRYFQSASGITRTDTCFRRSASGRPPRKTGFLRQTKPCVGNSVGTALARGLLI